jgi:hypothetical protein
MRPDRIFPALLILMQVGAGAVYFSSGDVRKGIQFIAGAVITAALAF